MNEQYEITFTSKLDETPQPALFMAASGDEPRPLVVALHTWSADLSQSWEQFRSRCEKRNWHCLYPLFRGPNWNRKACGSDPHRSCLAAESADPDAAAGSVPPDKRKMPALRR